MFLALLLNSLRLMLRQKLAWPLFLIAAVCLPFLSYFVFHADGTLTGVLKMMWGWQFYVSSAVLMLVTVYLSVIVLDSEFRSFQMLNTAVKPAPRWLILLAKFAAVCLLAGAGTALTGASAYTALRLRSAPDNVAAIRTDVPDTVNFNDDERKKDVQAQLAIAARDFFTSRTVRLPLMPDILAEIRTNIAAMKAEDFPGGKKPSEREMEDTARRIALRKSLPIPFNAAREFHFINLPQTVSPLTFRYKINGTKREETLGWLQAYWQFSGTDGKPPYMRESSFRGNTEQEFLIPGELIGADGKLDVVLYNISGPTEKSPAAEFNVAFTGLRVMLPHGSFAANFARAWLLLWVRLCLLAAIGVGFSPVIGAPVNGFLMIAVLFIGSLNSSIYTTFNPPFNPYRPVSETSADQAKRIAATLLSVLPNFAETDRVEEINGGTEIPWSYVWIQIFRDLILRGGVALAIGGLVFRRRELAIYRG